MHSDSIATNSSNVAMASSNAKDLAKKKRVNRSAKLKQCKLDARREQWLSQVKNKAEKEELNVRGICGPSTTTGNQRGRAIEKLEIRHRVKEVNDGGSIHHYSDSESPSNSPTSHAGSVLGGNDSSTNFTGSSSRSSSSSSSGGCCSGSTSEEDEDKENGCLDDWEAVADALAATDEKQQSDAHSLETAPGDKNLAHFDFQPDAAHQPVSTIDVSKGKPENGVSMQRAPVNCHAWRPDDAFRPQSLPNLSKQYSFPMKSDGHYGCGSSAWGCRNVASIPKSCPICYEDLDFTDSSFLPCLCGFRLCLFCHKRILEEDGRCPGCRKQYNDDLLEGEATLDGGSLTYRLTRSCSMITRS